MAPTHYLLIHWGHSVLDLGIDLSLDTHLLHTSELGSSESCALGSTETDKSSAIINPFANGSLSCRLFWEPQDPNTPTYRP